jgi:ACR3 family arsenite transporter
MTDNRGCECGTDGGRHSCGPKVPEETIDGIELQRMEDANDQSESQKGEEPAPNPNGINFFEKYLTLWVLLCMVIGGLIGAYQPVTAHELAKAEFANINAIVAVLLWLMILPMLIQIDFAAILAVRKAPGAIALTTCINYLIKPFTMYAIAILFFRVFYTHIMPDKDLRDNYIAGLILLAGAPCTAMVFVWSVLVGGDGAYTLVQVYIYSLAQ